MKDTINITISSELHLSERAKKACEIAKDYAAKSNNPKFHRTAEEKEASGNFSSEHSSEINFYENKIYNDSLAFNRKISIDDRIIACQQSIDAYYEFKAFCYKSYGGKIYFQDMWEYCHNIKSECFSYLECLTEELEKLQCRKSTQQIIDNLENDLYEILGAEDPILQSKLFSYYPQQLKKYIKKILDEWETLDIIRKTKYKNTYMIELID
ncbi:MAG: hypothetical protein PUE26_07990 [Ruminococcus sp.]|nr:hypothetical protein [Ruminococcus sp.]MDD6710072.1 hypothetical protein [Ruminococcus sp.]